MGHYRKKPCLEWMLTWVWTGMTGSPELLERWPRRAATVDQDVPVEVPHDGISPNEDVNYWKGARQVVN